VGNPSIPPNLAANRVVAEPSNYEYFSDVIGPWCKKIQAVSNELRFSLESFPVRHQSHVCK